MLTAVVGDVVVTMKIMIESLDIGLGTQHRCLH